MKEAFYIARHRQPGPVLVDVAKDALQAETEFRGRPCSTCPAITRDAAAFPAGPRGGPADRRGQPPGALCGRGVIKAGPARNCWSWPS